MEITVDMAVTAFNSGQGAWRGLLERQCGLGPTLLKLLDSKDELRMWMAEYKQKELVKMHRIQIQLDRVILDEEHVSAEGGK